MITVGFLAEWLAKIVKESPARAAWPITTDEGKVFIRAEFGKSFPGMVRLTESEIVLSTDGGFHEEHKKDLTDLQQWKALLEKSGVAFKERSRKRWITIVVEHVDVDGCIEIDFNAADGSFDSIQGYGD